MNARKEIKSNEFLPVQPEEAYDLAAECYDRWNWQTVWRSTEQRVVLERLRRAKMIESVIDVGCGTGSLLQRLSQAHPHLQLLGIDISEGMLARARARQTEGPIVFLHADVMTFAPSSRFDVAIMCRVASHIPSLDGVFAKIRSLLTGKGKLLLSDVYSGHDYAYTRVPTPFGKVSIETYKHKIEEVVRAGYQNGFSVSYLKPITANEIPGALRSDNSLPKIIRDYLAKDSDQPFGYVIEFSTDETGRNFAHDTRESQD